MIRIWVAGLALFFAASSAATIIDFGPIPNGNNSAFTKLTTQGFTFTSGNFGVTGRSDVCVFGGCVPNPNYLSAGFGNTPLPPELLLLTMVESGGGPFSLNAFDGDKLFMDDAAALASGFGNATSIRLTGTLSSGALLSQTFALNGEAAFQTFVLPNSWTNLRSVVFAGLPADGSYRSYAIDNINVTVLPEPSTAGLLLVTTLVLFVRRKTRGR